MICRDRAGAYAEGAHAGAPDVIQVADRWHLWDNLCQHVERLVASHHACLVPALDTGPGGDVVDPGESLWPDTTRVRNTRLRYEQTRELHERGLSMRVIARKLDLNFKTVRRYLHADSVETLLAGGVTASVLDPFKPYLHERVSQGVSNGTALLAEITERGYTGGYSTLARYPRPLRPNDPTKGLPPHPTPPAARGVAGWITGLPGHLDPADAVRLNEIRARCPEVDAAVRHVAGFARMIKKPVRRRGHPHRVDGCRRRGPAKTAIVHRRIAPRPRRRDRRTHNAIQLRTGRRHGEPHQTTQGIHVRRAKPDLLRKLILLA